MFRAYLLIIMRSKLHYTASGIITHIGGRLVHRLRESWNKLIVKQKFCASWLITEINILRCTVSKRSKNRCHLLLLFYFLETQHVSGISMFIFRSLLLCCWTTTLAVLLLDCCVLGLGCGSARVVSRMPAARIPPQPNRTLTPTYNKWRTKRPMWKFNNIVANSWRWAY